MTELKPLDIVLVCTKKGIVPRLIRYFTKFKYNHAGIVIEHLGKLYICEANAKGFHPTKEVQEWIDAKDKAGDEYIFLRAKKPIPKETGYERIDKMVGAGYEFLNLTLYQLVKVLTGWYPGTANNKRVICSEAVAYVFFEYFDAPYQTTPKEIYSNKNFKKLC